MSMLASNSSKIASPVIVTGMMRSGTTLLSEMVHKGGTPMYDVAANPDPSYDGGIRYERPLAHEIDHYILGLSQNTIGIKTVTTGAPPIESLKPISDSFIEKLYEEVGQSPWGFKNPRTSLTYSKWREAFPGGATLYIYRSHQEVLKHHYLARKNPLRRIKRMRMAAKAWLIFNQRLLEDIEMDKSQKRPYALVSYEQLMEDIRLIVAMQEATGVPLFDARDPNLYRNRKSKVKDNIYYQLAVRGLEQSYRQVYEALERQSLKS